MWIQSISQLNFGLTHCFLTKLLELVQQKMHSVSVDCGYMTILLRPSLRKEAEAGKPARELDFWGAAVIFWHRFAVSCW